MASAVKPLLDGGRGVGSVAIVAEVIDSTVFISHGVKSRGLATALAGYLDDHGWRAFLPMESVPLGRNWQSSIEKAIDSSEAIVILVEPDPSDQVRFEWSTALQASWEERGKKVIPVLPLGTEAPAFLRDFPSVRLTDDVDEQGFSEIVALIDSQDAEEVRTIPEEERSRLMDRLDQAIEALRSDVPDRNELEAHRDWLKGELETADSEGDAEKRAFLSLVIGRIEAGVGDKAVARDYLESALHSLRSQEQVDPEQLGTALIPLGDVLMELGDFDAAIDSFTEALEIESAEEAESPGVAAILEKIGVALIEAERPEEAMTFLRRALAISRDQLGDGHPRVSGLELWLGLAAENSGDYEAARDVYEQALQNREGADSEEDPTEQVMRLWGLGEALSRLAEFDAARESFRRAIDLAEKGEPTPALLAPLYGSLGNVEKDRANWDGACAQYEQAVALFRQADESEPAAVTLSTLGMVLHEKGDLGGAKRVLSEALRESEEAFGSTSRMVINSLFLLGVVAQEEGDRHQAEKRMRQAIELETQTGSADPRRLKKFQEALDRLLAPSASIAS